jgi:hypothetical protein
MLMLSLAIESEIAKRRQQRQKTNKDFINNM